MEQEEKKGINPHLYQRSYTKEEMEALVQWFEVRKERLPDTLRLNASTVAGDLRKTVSSYLSVIRNHFDNFPVMYYNYVTTLRLIQYRLQEQGME